jgi:acetyltransferase-like isoleucine patch superfamily enzyme
MTKRERSRAEALKTPLLYRAAIGEKMKSFSERRIFAGKSAFGVRTSFAAGTRFGYGCTFDHNCEFGEGCRFGPRCDFEYGASFGPSCRIGSNSYVGSSASFECGCEFGSKCKIGSNASFGRECRLEDGCVVMFNARFEKNCILGRDCEVWADATMSGQCSMGAGTELSAPIHLPDRFEFQAKVSIAGRPLAPIRYPVVSASGFGSEARRTTGILLASGEILVMCGCWSGTLVEFRERIRSEYGAANATRGAKCCLAEYEAMANLFEARMSHWHACGRSRATNADKVCAFAKIRELGKGKP